MQFESSSLNPVRKRAEKKKKREKCFFKCRNVSLCLLCDALGTGALLWSPAALRPGRRESAAGRRGLSGPPALDDDGAGHDVVHSPVVLEEEEGDEDGEEEGDGEVLVEGAHRGAARDERKERSHEELETSAHVRLRWEHVPREFIFFPKSNFFYILI